MRKELKNLTLILTFFIAFIWYSCENDTPPSGIVEDFNLVPPVLVFNSIGESRQIQVYVKFVGQDAIYLRPKWASFSSTNTSIASVDEEGVVSAIGSGTCKIKVSFKGLQREVSVKVSPNWSDPYADEVVETNFGYGAGFGQDQLPDILLGCPKGGGEWQGSLDVVSLGQGGSITLGFTNNLIVNEPGPDFIVFENGFCISGDCHNMWNETMIVQVSQDGKEWIEFPFDYTPPNYSDPDSFWNIAGSRPVYANCDENSIDPTDPQQAGGDAFDLDDVELDYISFIKVIDTGHPNHPETLVSDMNGDTVDDSGKHSGNCGSSCGADLDTITAANWTHCQGLIFGPEIQEVETDMKILTNYLATSWHEINLSGVGDSWTITTGCWPEPTSKLIKVGASLASSDTTILTVDNYRIIAQNEGTATLTAQRSQLSYEITVNIYPDVIIVNPDSQDFTRIRSSNFGMTNNVSSTGPAPKGLDILKDNLFLVISDSNELWKYSLNDLSLMQTIGLGSTVEYPQDVLILNEKLAVICSDAPSNNSSYIVKVNLETGETVKKIELPEAGAYSLSALKEHLFVGMSNSSNGKVYIVDLSTDEVLDKVLTSNTPNCKSSIVKRGRVYVLCEGDSTHPSVVEVFEGNGAFDHLATLSFGANAKAVSIKDFGDIAYLGDGENEESLLYSIDLKDLEVIRDQNDPIKLDPGSSSMGKVTKLAQDRYDRVWAIDEAKKKIFIFNLADDQGSGQVEIKKTIELNTSPGEIYIRPLFR